MSYRLTSRAPLAAALLLAGCQPMTTVGDANSPAVASRTVIRVATWNLEHLAEANGTGCRPRTNADYEELRRHAQRLRADVVALQEVENERAAARVFPKDEWVVVMSGRPGSGRTEYCREAPTTAIRRQAVGFAIRRGIPFRRNADVRELGLGDPDLRWGVDVTLQLATPLRLLAVHLKSGCNSGRDTQDRDCAILFEQASILESWIDARARAQEDFAVLGDWNRRTALAGDAFLEIVSDDDPPEGRLMMTDADQPATCVARFRDLIDHIAISAAATDRVIPGSFAEYRYDGDESRYPSDHCPLSVQIRSR